jgi:hypothetical protein
MIAGLLYAWKETLPFDVAALFALALVPVYVIAQRRANAMPRQETAAVVREADYETESVEQPSVEPAASAESTTADPPVAEAVT